MPGVFLDVPVFGSFVQRSAEREAVVDDDAGHAIDQLRLVRHLEDVDRILVVLDALYVSFVPGVSGNHGLVTAATKSAGSILVGPALPAGVADSGGDWAAAVADGELTAIDGPTDARALAGGAGVAVGDPQATTSRRIEARRRVAFVMAFSSSRGRSGQIVRQVL